MGAFQHWVRENICKIEKKEEKSSILCWESGAINPFYLAFVSEYVQASLRILWMMYYGCFISFCFNLGFICFLLWLFYVAVYFMGLFLLRGTTVSVLGQDKTKTQ